MVIPKSVSQLQRVTPPVLPRKEQVLEGSLFDQSCSLCHNHSLVLPNRPDPPPTAIPTLGGRPLRRQSRYKLPVCKDPILPLPPHIPIYTITAAHQPPKIEDKPIDVDATEPDLNVDFEEHTPQQERITHDVYERPGQEYLQESLECNTNLVQRLFT